MLYAAKVFGEDAFVPDINYPIIVLSNEGEFFEGTQEAYENMFARSGMALETPFDWSFTENVGDRFSIRDESYGIGSICLECGDVHVLGVGKFHYVFDSYSSGDFRGKIYLVVPAESGLSWQEVYNIMESDDDTRGLHYLDGDVNKPLSMQELPDVFEGSAEFNVYIYPVG